MEKKKNLSRRKFLGQTSCAAVGYTTLFSSLLNLKAFEAAALDNSSLMLPCNDYKAMICVLLGGGNDSFNMLIPGGGTQYEQYAVTRSNLAIPLGDILPISPTNTPGNTFGLHPSMPEVQGLFDSGKLGFISNVGTLVQPTTRDEFFSGTHPLPLGLFSHADQAQQWQTGRPHERSAIGWGGRISDLVQSMNSNENISMNISMSGTNTFQHGQDTIEYVISSEGSIGIAGYNESGIVNQLRSQAIDNMLDQSYSDIYKSTYINTVKGSRDAGAQFQEAIDAIPEFGFEFGDNSLSLDFRMIAKTIAARESLGFQRQIFFVNYGGWDHHDEVLENQAGMLAEVSRALSDLNAALEELDVADCVTTFTVSDFARTLTSNGNGTDHAWGGNALVMGGSVNGGNLYGAYPDLNLGIANPLDLEGGVLIPTTSADEYLAELALWYGVSAADVNDILPNLANFYDTSSPDLPLGFLNL